MGVIPFVLNDTVVTSPDQFERKGGRNGKTVLIEHFQEEQLTKDGASNATYDLRVGTLYRDHHDDGATQVEDNGAIDLYPGAALIIQAEERVHFPRTIFGQIVPKVSLLQEGVSNTSSKVDPGYRGPLLITVFNLGRKPHTFKPGTPFCNLYLLRVEPESQPYSKDPQALPAVRARSAWRRLREFALRNRDWVLIYVNGLILLINFLFFVLSRRWGTTGTPAPLPSHLVR